MWANFLSLGREVKMEENKNVKKIVILGIILLILAGIVVVALKGFNVSLLFGKHEAVQIKLDVDVDLKKVQEACEETFAEKKFVVRGLEVFGDSAQINVESITDEEKNTLIGKLNEKFGTEKTVEDLNISSVSNKRIRDVVKPYIMPMIILYVIVFIYMLIRFRSQNPVQLILTCIWKTILIEALLISVMAIGRVAVDEFLISVLVLIAIGYLCYQVSIGEKKLEN